MRYVVHIYISRVVSSPRKEIATAQKKEKLLCIGDHSDQKGTLVNNLDFAICIAVLNDFVHVYVFCLLDISGHLLI
jgi:hypothetical protein